MLRITENIDSDKIIKLRLDGTISESSFAEIQAAFTRHVENSRGVIVVLDMAGVVFMNNDAVKSMVQLRSARLRMINCSPFIEMLLKTTAETRAEHVDELKS